jgi:hypothetical protein
MGRVFHMRSAFLTVSLSKNALIMPMSSRFG